MTNKEIIERVKSLYQAGVSSDDNRMSDRLIYSVLYTVKSMLIRQEIGRNKETSPRNLDYLECIPMAKAEAHDCPCAPPSGCLILKSTCKIPRPINTKYGELVNVTSIDGSTTFPKTSWIAKSKKKGNKYTSKTRDSFFKNDYLYITVPKADGLPLKTVTVSGVFENISDFFCSYCEDCDDINNCLSPLDMEFKLDSSSIENLISLTVQELVRTFSSQQDDKLNNSNDDIQEQNSQYYTRRPVR